MASLSMYIHSRTRITDTSYHRNNLCLLYQEYKNRTHASLELCRRRPSIATSYTLKASWQQILWPLHSARRVKKISEIWEIRMNKKGRQEKISFTRCSKSKKSMNTLRVSPMSLFAFGDQFYGQMRTWECDSSIESDKSMIWVGEVDTF